MVQAGLALTYAGDIVRHLGDVGDWQMADPDVHDEQWRLDRARIAASMAVHQAKRLVAECEIIEKTLIKEGAQSGDV